MKYQDIHFRLSTCTQGFDRDPAKKPFKMFAANSLEMLMYSSSLNKQHYSTITSLCDLK